MKKIIKMFLISMFLAFLLLIAICFENFKIRMGIVIFMYSFSFFIIMKFGGDYNENQNGKNGDGYR